MEQDMRRSLQLQSPARRRRSLSGLIAQLALLSLALTGTVIWISALSHSHWWADDGRDAAVGIQHGAIWWGRTGTAHASRYVPAWSWYPSIWIDYELTTRFLPAVERPGWPTANAYQVAVPLWPFALLAAVLAWRPAALLISRARRLRAPRPGFCRCGYNLTGNVSGRCPECGLLLCAPQIAAVMS
jgi:hypothetical protein